MSTTDALIPPRDRLFAWVDATMAVSRHDQTYRKVVVQVPEGSYTIRLASDNTHNQLLFVYVENPNRSVVVYWRYDGSKPPTMFHALQSRRSDWRGHSWDQQITPPPPIQVVQCVHLIRSAWVDLFAL